MFEEHLLPEWRKVTQKRPMRIPGVIFTDCLLERLVLLMFPLSENPNIEWLEGMSFVGREIFKVNVIFKTFKLERLILVGCMAIEESPWFVWSSL